MIGTMTAKYTEHLEEASLYDLQARLYTPEALFEHAIDGRRWIVFAPDYVGQPVVVDDRIHGFLQSFRGGAVASDIIARDGDFVSSLSTIATLVDRGFLREAPANLPYPVPWAGGRPRNISVWLHITNSCNLTCAYCFVGDKSSECMTDEVMERVACDIAQTAKNSGIEQVDLKFAGGEPTLFVKRMERFRSLLSEQLAGSTVKLQFSVLSNGTLLNERLLAFLRREDTSISISLDGYGEAHDTFRVFRSNRGSWGIVSENIKKLCAQGIRPYIMATIGQETCHSLPALVKWILGNGLRCRLSVVRQPNCSWVGSRRDEEYEAMNARLAEAFDRTFTALEDPEVMIDLRSGFDLCELYFDRPGTGVPCGIGHNHLVIKPDGNMVCCPMTVAEKGVSPAGDLLAAASLTFQHAPHERYFVREEDDCLSCKWFGVCSGGCPITNLRMTGHAFTRSPLCSFYKSVIPRYLTFFGRKLLQAEQKAGTGGAGAERC
jgi:uncharacterized protein